ncbi:hypothetical protein BC832DRAFT_560550 [Gaertneriomyces semiglobifer]|nr:hypothetical protein BC832DRAFT_560550 [Gaertneriomyces semiglobifer]
MADALAVPGQTPGLSPGAKTVLFALDESSHAMAALNWTFDYILRNGDKLTVLIVVDKEDVSAVTNRIKTLLRSVWQSNNVECSMSIRVLVGGIGKAGELIVKCVEELLENGQHPAMLVLGSAGKSHVQGMLVGSVSNYCIKNAPIPVIVARCSLSEDGRGRSSDNVKGNRMRSVSPYWA